MIPKIRCDCSRTTMPPANVHMTIAAYSRAIRPFNPPAPSDTGVGGWQPNVIHSQVDV